MNEFLLKCTQRFSILLCKCLYFNGHLQKLSAYASTFGNLFERVTWQEIKIETRSCERWLLANLIVQHRMQNRKPCSLKKLDAADPFSCLCCYVDTALSFRTPWQVLKSCLERYKCTLNCPKWNSLISHRIFTSNMKPCMPSATLLWHQGNKEKSE